MDEVVCSGRDWVDVAITSVVARVTNPLLRRLRPDSETVSSSSEGIRRVSPTQVEASPTAGRGRRGARMLFRRLAKSCLDIPILDSAEKFGKVKNVNNNQTKKNNYLETNRCRA